MFRDREETQEPTKYFHTTSFSHVTYHVAKVKNLNSWKLSFFGDFWTVSREMNFCKFSFFSNKYFCLQLIWKKNWYKWYPWEKIHNPFYPRNPPPLPLLLFPYIRPFPSSPPPLFLSLHFIDLLLFVSPFWFFYFLFLHSLDVYQFSLFNPLSFLFFFKFVPPLKRHFCSFKLILRKRTYFLFWRSTLSLFLFWFIIIQQKYLSQKKHDLNEESKRKMGKNGFEI